MWWLNEGCGGSMREVMGHWGMWWVNEGCGGSMRDVVAQLRHVVAQ